MSTSKTLRTRNRARVLRTIVLARETTRAALASACGISPATVSTVISDLIAEGLVEEVGSVPSDGGRPTSRIAMRAAGGHLIGIDVGEHGVAVELFDLTMTRRDREFRDSGGHEATAHDVAAMIAEAVAAVRERNAGPLLGIGLGLPGVVEENDGNPVLYAQSLGWPPVRIADLIGPIDVPVYASNGATSLAEGELWFGAARDVQHGLVVLLGRGVGLGVISDGQLLHGSRGSAWEWGHTRLSFDGGPECRCGARGCIEAYLGADAILDRWRAAGGTVEGRGWRALSAFVDAAAAGDAVASEVLEQVLDQLGAALGSLVNLTNPERVVIGGWVGLRLLASHRDQIHARIVENCLTRPGMQFSLELCHFEGDAVALGAALLPLKALIEQPLAASPLTVSGAA